MNLPVIIATLSIPLTGLIVNAPPVRSRLKTPIIRAAAAALLAGAISYGGFLLFSAG
jgi:hypothetical protein